MTEHDPSEGAKHAIDLLSALVAVGTIATWLPPLAALLTIVWTLIRIWETDTVREWTNRNKRN